MGTGGCTAHPPSLTPALPTHCQYPAGNSLRSNSSSGLLLLLFCRYLLPQGHCEYLPDLPPQVTAASGALRASSPIASANVTCCGKEPDSDRIVWSRYERAGKQAHYHAPCVIPLFPSTWHGVGGRHHSASPPPRASLYVRPLPPLFTMQVLPGGCHGRQLHRPLVQILARL